MGKDLKGRELGAGFSQRPDGRYVKQYRFNGKTKSVYGFSLKECRQKYDSVLVTISQGRYNDKICETLDTYFKRYLAYRHDIGDIKESTERNYKIWYHAYLSPILGSKRLDKICRADGKHVQSELRKNDRICAGTVNDLMDLLSTILKAAVNDELIPLNPIAGIPHVKEDKILTVAKTTHRALSIEEQQIFMEYAKKEWYGNLIDLLLRTGIRQGEARGLFWSDIDYENNVLHIQRTATVDVNGKLAFDTPKTTTSRRDIPLRPDIIEIFERQKKQNEAVFGKSGDKDSVVFKSVEGKVVSRNALKACFNHIAEMIQINEKSFERITPHALRATFATRAIENGMDPQTLKTLLGHNSFKMTMDLYVHVLPSTRQAEMDKIVTGFENPEQSCT